jgi:hypothetical protein
MFWSIIIIPITGFFTKKVVDYFYPNKINEIVQKYSYNCGWIILEKISWCETYLYNFYYRYKEYIPFSININNQQIIFVKDGEEIEKLKFNEFMIKQTNKDILSEYDFILHHIPIQTIDKYDKYASCVKRYNNSNDIVEYSFVKAPKCIEFTMVVLSIKNSHKTYCIDYGNKQFNINGNVLYDCSFLKWVLKKYHNISITDSDEYTLSFIDHNMNYITIPNTCYILLENDEYKLVNYV